jgi:hypothetical protein
MIKKLIFSKIIKKKLAFYKTRFGRGKFQACGLMDYSTKRV